MLISRIAIVNNYIERKQVLVQAGRLAHQSLGLCVCLEGVLW